MQTMLYVFYLLSVEFMTAAVSPTPSEGLLIADMDIVSTPTLCFSQRVLIF